MKPNVQRQDTESFCFCLLCQSRRGLPGWQDDCNEFYMIPMNFPVKPSLVPQGKNPKMITSPGDCANRKGTRRTAGSLAQPTGLKIPGIHIFKDPLHWFSDPYSSAILAIPIIGTFFMNYALPERIPSRDPNHLEARSWLVPDHSRREEYQYCGG